MISILVDGPICSGKTTVVQGLAREGFLPIVEPVTKAHKDFFYENPKKNGLVFDVLLASQRTMDWITQHARAAEKVGLRGVVGDRWAPSARVFINAYMEDGPDKQLLEDVIARLEEDLSPPTHIVLLTCPIEELQRRLLPRSLCESADSEKNGVTGEYLAKLEKGYAEYGTWLGERFPDAKLVHLNSENFVSPAQVLDSLGLNRGEN